MTTTAHHHDRECRSCNRPGLTHRGRGLCFACWRRHDASGTLEQYAPLPTGREAQAQANLTAYAELRNRRVSPKSAAWHLSVSVRTIQRYEARLREAAS